MPQELLWWSIWQINPGEHHLHIQQCDITRGTNSSHDFLAYSSSSSHHFVNHQKTITKNPAIERPTINCVSCQPFYRPLCLYCSQWEKCFELLKSFCCSTSSGHYNNNYHSASVVSNSYFVCALWFNVYSNATLWSNEFATIVLLQLRVSPLWFLKGTICEKKRLWKSQRRKWDFHIQASATQNRDGSVSKLIYQ